MSHLVVLTLLVHVALLWAPFDIYFVSPIVTGMTPVKSNAEAAAKRVVLIVADGLRSEAMYGDQTKSRAPFLTKVREKRGSWGVAHTRVPTESRPGHVAILAGIYEDPSAILHGWKVNPVVFDTVINQSRKAWCWGSPDIVHMFNRDKKSHIRIESYDSTMQDFGESNTTLLDDWVFERVKSALHKQNKIACTDLCQNGNFFFLHLLGIDTAGHAYKPHSDVYNSNINFVDQKVQEIESVFESFFDDKSTAYIFTSDHGMTDWGSHGAGTNHETEVPFIAWGSGIKTNPYRQDLNQADIAPFMSVLIGRHIPVNSVGILPYKYLDANKGDLAEMVFTNVKQLLELYNTKRIKYESNLFQWMYRPYELTNKIADQMQHIKNRISDNDYSEAILASFEVMKMIHGGLDYFHTYFQRLLLSCITSGMLTWIVYVIINIIRKEDYMHFENIESSAYRANVFAFQNKNYRKWIFSGTGFLILAIVYFVYSQSLPFMYNIYLAFPVVMFACILMDAHKLTTTFYHIKSYGFSKSILTLLVCLMTIEFLVQGFFSRFYFSVVMVAVGFWIFTLPTKVDGVKLSWLFVNTSMAVFTALPVMNTKFNIFMVLIGISAWFIALFVVFRKDREYIWNKNFSSPSVVLFQMIVFTVAYINTLMVAYTFHISQGLLAINQFTSWTIFAVAFLIPLLIKSYVFAKMLSITMGLVSFYVLVTVNYEMLFILNFSVLMYLWMQLECNIVFDKANVWKYLQSVGFPSRDENLNSDVRHALFYLTFIFIGFFGTGNIASLNSFDPMWVRCFLTVFSPFTMTGLIVFKLLVPFLIVTCTFRVIGVISQRKQSYSFAVVLIFTDLMLVHFLHYVQTEGSWLDIGTSLSHYLIFELITIVLILLYGAAYILTTFTFPFKTFFNIKSPAQIF